MDAINTDKMVWVSDICIPLRIAAVSCSSNGAMLGGVGFGFWLTGSWAVHGIGAWHFQLGDVPAGGWVKANMLLPNHRIPAV